MKNSLVQLGKQCPVSGRNPFVASSFRKKAEDKYVGVLCKTYRIYIADCFVVSLAHTFQKTHRPRIRVHGSDGVCFFLFFFAKLEKAEADERVKEVQAGSQKGWEKRSVTGFVWLKPGWILTPRLRLREECWLLSGPLWWCHQYFPWHHLGRRGAAGWGSRLAVVTRPD